MTIYLEKRLAAAMRMAACADSVCARNSHLHLAALYRLRLARMRAAAQGRMPDRARAPRFRGPGDSGDMAAGPSNVSEHRV
jgi:hypothetical protein